VKDKVEFDTGKPLSNSLLKGERTNRIVKKDETIEIGKIDRSPFKIIEKLVDV
jgi:hypothetical protein